MWLYSWVCLLLSGRRLLPEQLIPTVRPWEREMRHREDALMEGPGVVVTICLRYIIVNERADIDVTMLLHRRRCSSSPHPAALATTHHPSYPTGICREYCNTAPITSLPTLKTRMLKFTSLLFNSLEHRARSVLLYNPQEELSVAGT